MNHSPLFRVVPIVALALFTNANALLAQPLFSDKMVSKWVLAEFKNDRVKNEISGGGVLRTSEVEGVPAPELSKDAKTKGLLFKNASRMMGKVKDIPILKGFGIPGQAFSIKISLVPLERPVGIYGGIFEAMTYGTGGFRIVMKQDLNLVLEYCENGDTVDALHCDVPLELGKLAVVEVFFEKKQFVVKVNGKTAGTVKEGKFSPGPEEFMIGMASGERYEFDGIISEVSITALRE